MKEKFEPFKELLKALREIRYAIGCKNNGTGNGNGSDIVLPKYLYGYVENVETLLEIDYDGKLIDFYIKSKNGLINPSTFSEEELTNLMKFVATHTYLIHDVTKQIVNPSIVYTKEQKDAINKNSIIIDNNGEITKLNNFVFLDLCDFFVATHIPSTLDIQKGQYYTIMHPNCI